MNYTEEAAGLVPSSDQRLVEGSPEYLIKANFAKQFHSD